MLVASQHCLMKIFFFLDRPKKFSLKSFKRYYFVFKDTHLSIYKTAEDQDQAPIQKFNLRGIRLSSLFLFSATMYTSFLSKHYR